MQVKIKSLFFCLLPFIVTYWLISTLVSGMDRKNEHSARQVEVYSKKSVSLAQQRTKNQTELPTESVCHTPQCISFYESTVFTNSCATRIPRMRHLLWRSNFVPGYFAKHLASWQSVQPNWTYVLWRDSDLVKFVAKHYPRALSKFYSLKEKIMKIDMIRYMILHRYGGVYADLDYTLVRPLDRFLKFPTVVTRETEAHAFLQFGMNPYPPKLLGNPAFMMSEPGHPFFRFSIEQLVHKKVDSFMTFAGPIAVTHLVMLYAKQFPLQSGSPDRLVIVPASRCFYPFDNNNFASSQSLYKKYIVSNLNEMCRKLKNSHSIIASELKAYCRDINNLDPITDPNEPVYAIHDFNKSTSSYDPSGSVEFRRDSVDIKKLLRNVIMADSIY